MPKYNVRVNIPSNPTEQIDLLGKVSAKHTALGASSPPAGLDWTKINPKLADAKAHDDEATKLDLQLEKEYGARDASMPSVTDALRSARDILLGTYRDNPKTLGDFGYTVDDSAPSSAKTPLPARNLHRSPGRSGRLKLHATHSAKSGRR